MKKFLVVLVGLLGFSLHTFAQDNVKVMYYNILEYPLNPSTKAVYLKTIFDYYHPDVLVCDEVTSDAVAIDILNNVINITGTNHYAKALFTAGPDKNNMIFYNIDKLSLKLQDTIHTALRWMNRYRLYHNTTTSDTVYLDFYAAHLKASNTPADVLKRYYECVHFKNYIATKTQGQNIIFGGDLNLYTSVEDAYQLLLGPTNYPLYDPINSPGAWNANSSFSAIHTQSTHITTSGGFIGGGLDDRFDFILVTNDLLTPTNNAHYIANSYKALGNDGLHFNKNLTDLPLSTTVPEIVTNAMYNMSDHLPVVMELAVNATSSVSDHLQFAGMPATGNTLVNLSPFTVEVRNSLNVLNTGFTGSITLSKLQGAGNLIGTLTANAVGGIATFSDVRFDQSGTYKLACSASGLTSGNSDNIVITSLGPDNLQFVGVPSSGNPSINLAPFTVEVHDIANQVYAGYSGSITLSKLAGTGNLLGTLTVNTVAGIATFSDVRFDQAGTYSLTCSASGLTPSNSNNIIITAAIPTLTELVVPKYIGSKTATNTNDTRTSTAFCLRLDNLSPNTSYDLKVGLALTSEAATVAGAGNVWKPVDGYGSTKSNTIPNAFTTNSIGSSGLVWVIFQPTGNGTRFDGGQVHNIRVGYAVNGTTMASTPNFVGTKTITALDIAQTARTITTSDDGAFIKGNADPTASGKYALLYDNEAGTGDPLFCYQIRQAIATSPTNSQFPTLIDDIYMQGGTGTSAISDYPAVIPIGANNPNGVRRIESRNSDNTIYGYNTDSDGIWPSGTNTTTISRRSVALINSTEAPLTPVIVTKTLNLIVFLEGLYNGSGTMLKAKDISGDRFTGITADQITVELRSSSTYSTVAYTAYNVNLSTSGIASLSIPPDFNGSYYITIKHRNSIEVTTPSAMSFLGSTINYNYSDIAIKAFGSNLVQMIDGKWAIYGGDVNQDGVVDAGDLSVTDNDAANFLTGYIAADVNGDGLIDTNDIDLINSNSTSFVATKIP
jgi:hypothetical protein